MAPIVWLLAEGQAAAHSHAADYPSSQPKAVKLLRGVTIVLILLTAGLGGGISYSALAKAELDMVSRKEFLLRACELYSVIIYPTYLSHPSPQFEKQYLDAFGMMQFLFNRSMADRITSAEAATVLFRIPRGGKIFFPLFDDFSRRQLDIGGGDSCEIAPIIFPSDREVRMLGFRRVPGVWRVYLK